MAIEWMIVKNSWTKKPIGAVGFVDGKLAIVTAFFEDKDADQDGKVSLGEKVFSFGNMKGRAVAEVANHAYADRDIMMRDASIYQLRGQLTVQFAAGLLAEGIYKAYFSMGVGKVAGAIAGAIAKDAVKSFVIKKGLEKAVEKAYRESLGV
ncbi:hypothetical protein [Tabrizicola sp.]|uniref:hypothetical protein n=1 Tax=Tabrizicola sp. TaxID=2005166 RepID=UPI003F344D20